MQHAKWRGLVSHGVHEEDQVDSRSRVQCLEAAKSLVEEILAANRQQFSPRSSAQRINPLIIRELLAPNNTM